MPKNIHHRHGENIHKMEQIPEKPALGRAPDLPKGSRGNLPPAEVKRITRQASKRKAKKQANQAQA